MVEPLTLRRAEEAIARSIRTENGSGQTGGAAEVEHDFERVLARGALLAVAVHVAPWCKTWIGLFRFARLQDGLVLESLSVTMAHNLVGFRLS